MLSVLSPAPRLLGALLFDWAAQVPLLFLFLVQLWSSAGPQPAAPELADRVMCPGAGDTLGQPGQAGHRGFAPGRLPRPDDVVAASRTARCVLAAGADLEHRLVRETRSKNISLKESSNTENEWRQHQKKMPASTFRGKNKTKKIISFG